MYTLYLKYYVKAFIITGPGMLIGYALLKGILWGLNAFSPSTVSSDVMNWLNWASIISQSAGFGITMAGALLILISAYLKHHDIDIDQLQRSPFNHSNLATLTTPLSPDEIIATVKKKFRGKAKKIHENLVEVRVKRSGYSKFTLTKVRLSLTRQHAEGYTKILISCPPIFFGTALDYGKGLIFIRKLEQFLPLTNPT